jgi:hypothetical protein
MNTDEDGSSDEDSSCETEDAASTVSDDDMSISDVSFESFNKLLDMLYPNLQLKEKYAKMSGTKPISCEIMLHCTL